MPARAARIYVASPLGFTDAGRMYSDTVLLPAVRAAGFEPVDPWEVDADVVHVFGLARDDPERRTRLAEVNRLVGKRNAELIRSAAGVLAILDGDDVDSGTAAEIGYAFARGKLIVGYRGDFRLSADNEGSTVNLQVEYFIRASGGTIVERYEDLGPALGALGGARRSGTRARPAGPGRRSARRRRVR